ncbi:MAG: sigma 54-interacting transcriptional regulator [Rhodospirillaceae bacterium]|nr:sigma 54-interacting transcriptional regulator [Rhodospirillaceae bacterium]
MRADVHGLNRTGITHEVLAVLARHSFDLQAVEVVPNHIFLHAPGLTAEGLPDLRRELLGVPGVHGITEISLLPRERQHLEIEALLETIPDPVLAVDGEGRLHFANRAAAAVGADGKRLDETAGLAELADDIRQGRSGPQQREVVLGGRHYLVELLPIAGDGGGASSGAVVILRSPSRVGEWLSTVGAGGAKGFDAVLGGAAEMQALKQRAMRLAALDAPLLISGETGTGKELFARACHGVSRRSAGPFLALNCAALPESLAESELFGYAPGAFTSALRQGKPGLLELADGGSLFLDEVGELTPYLQAKLLRVLQDGTYRRIGGRQELQADVRILSATNRNLEAMAAGGAFRVDLFYRLNVLSLAIPPLRERRTDIPLLADHFLARASAQIGRAEPRLGTDALAALAAAPWPGNVRQLENVIFRAVSLTDGPVIRARDLDLGPPAEAAGGTAEDEPADWAAAQQAFESRLLARLYPRYPSSRKLARRLGVSHTTIADKLRRYGIGRPD